MSDGPLFERLSVEEKDRSKVPDVWSVAELNRSVRLSLESEWGGLWVQGEIAELTRAATGHVYFTLNDETEQAQLRSVMFRSDARRARARLERGARIRAFGRLSLYEPRGSFQFIAQRAEDAGEGTLAAQLRRLMKKLAAEGLTDPGRKRALPLLPRTVGVVTSEHGAAVHDILRVTRGRCPVRLVLAPCLVQGAAAPAQIVRALTRLQALPQLDVVIVARGGGSAEDLFAFNDEAVARAVAGCRVPVVSGVGHETDVTLCDMVADVRAATPSNAAELVCPESASLRERLNAQDRSLARGLEVRITRARMALAQRERSLPDPHARLRIERQGLDRWTVRMARAARENPARHRSALQAWRVRLGPHSPQNRVRTWRSALALQQGRLVQSPKRWFSPARSNWVAAVQALPHAAATAQGRRRQTFGELVAKLSALSPLSVLARGYAVALHERTGRALLRAEEAAPGDRLRLRLHKGELPVLVEER